jgi:CubicO group peptidase (beta-lactamase class C family)
MFRILRTLFLLLFLSDGSMADEPTKNELAEIIANARTTWNAPGLAAVVVKDGRILYLGGDGLRKLGGTDAVTADTLFPLASCTKAFTSSIVASLVDDGTLGWDDPVRKHLPNFHLADPDADKLVSLRDLLTHRTGLGGHDLLWYRAPWDLDEVVRRTAKLPLELPFRGGFQYSSLPWIAAGKAIENRTGKSYGELMRDRLGKPLGWKTGTVTSKDAAKFEDRAIGYRRAGEGKFEPMPEHEMKEANAAGSLSLSARDLGAFLTFQLANGEYEGKRIVSEANLKETRTPHTPMRRSPEMAATYPHTVQASYAMGWVVYDYRGHEVAGHGGIIDGFRAQITLLPDAKAGFALVNNLHGTKLNLALGNILIDRLLGLPAKDWHAYYRQLEADETAAREKALALRTLARARNPVPPIPPDNYSGEYEHPAYGTAAVRAKDGKLTLAYGSFELPLEHWESNRFRILGDSVLAEELVEFDGKGDTAKALLFHGLVFQRK